MRNFGLATFAAIACVFMLGCSGCTGNNATGYEPGPSSNQMSDVPIPGLGVARLSGERDTDISIVGMKGDGVHWPSIEQVTITRSASGPLATRGSAQTQVEQMRYEMQIRGLERAIDRLDALLTNHLPAILAAANRPPEQPTSRPFVEGTQERMLRALDLILAKLEK